MSLCITFASIKSTAPYECYGDLSPNRIKEMNFPNPTALFWMWGYNGPDVSFLLILLLTVRAVPCLLLNNYILSTLKDFASSDLMIIASLDEDCEVNMSLMIGLVSQSYWELFFSHLSCE